MRWNRDSKDDDQRDMAGRTENKDHNLAAEKSLKALAELRLATDADTDSEVFRNVLRLHLALIRAHSDGVQRFMKRNDKEENCPGRIVCGCGMGIEPPIRSSALK